MYAQWTATSWRQRAVCVIYVSTDQHRVLTWQAWHIGVLTEWQNEWEFLSFLTDSLDPWQSPSLVDLIPPFLSGKIERLLLISLFTFILRMQMACQDRIKQGKGEHVCACTCTCALFSFSSFFFFKVSCRPNMSLDSKPEIESHVPHWMNQWGAPFSFYFRLAVHVIQSLCELVELGISTAPCTFLKNVPFRESFILPLVAYNSWLCLSSNA